MQQNQFQQTKQQQTFKTARILWLVFLITPWMLGGVIHLGSKGEPTGIAEEMKYILFGMGFVVALGSLGLRKTIPPSSEKVEKWLTRYILCWVFNETISLFGMMGATLSHEFSFALPFLVVSTVLTATLYPTPNRN